MRAKAFDLVLIAAMILTSGSGSSPCRSLNHAFSPLLRELIQASWIVHVKPLPWTALVLSGRALDPQWPALSLPMQLPL